MYAIPQHSILSLQPHQLPQLKVVHMRGAGVRYHAVIASEVIEHVSNPAGFLQTLARLLRDDGALVVSTISRTARSYAFAIVGAEMVSGIIPRGTHDWNKFLTPGKCSASTCAFIENSGCCLQGFMHRDCMLRGACCLPSG